MLSSAVPADAGVNITGTIFNDNAGTGSTTVSGSGIGNVTVYEDENGNGILDSGDISAVTAANGTYTLANVPTGSGTVRIVVPAGFVATDPGNGSQSVAAPANGVNFPLYETMTVNGLVYDDTNGNGFRDVSESGAAGIRVFQDLNGNGMYDPGEPTTLSDSSGAYSLTGVAPSRTDPGEGISVLFVAPAGDQVEETGYALDNGPGSIEFLNAPLTSQSYVFGYTQFRATAGGYASPGGQTVYADLNNNGQLDAGEPSETTAATGRFILGNLPAGPVTLRINTSSYYTAETSAMTVNVPKLSYTVAAFNLTSTTTPPTGSISGLLFNDANSNGFDDPGELPVAGQTVYIDTNNNGKLDSGEPTAVSDSTGTYVFNGLAPGTYTVRESLTAGYVSALPAQTITLFLNQGATTTFAGINLGSRYAPVSTISGVVFNDTNFDQSMDDGETGLAGRTVYIDTNNDGVLDAGDVSATTNAGGQYTFTGLSPGTYVVRQVLPSGWVTSEPAAGYYTVVATGVQTFTENFGSYQTGTLSGFVYDDVNGDGVQETGDTPIIGRTVELYVPEGTAAGTYISTVTTSSGYTFSNLAPGYYLPSTVLPKGWEETTPVRGVEGAGGATVTVNAGATTQVPIGEDMPIITPSAGGPYSVAPNGNITLSAAGSSDSGYGQIESYAWDLNYNGTFTSTAAGETTRFAASGLATGQTRTVAVQVTDLIGDTAIATATVTVINGGTIGSADDPGPNLETIYLDANNNGVLDPGEQSVLTSPDPFGGGTYYFGAVPSGTYTVRQVLPSDYVQLYPLFNAGFPVTVTNGASVGIPQFNDDPKSQVGTVTGSITGGAVGETIYVDIYSNNDSNIDEPSTTLQSNDTYTIPNVPYGTYYVRQSLPAGYTQTSPAANEGVSVTVLAASTVTAGTFVDTPPAATTGTLSGSVFTDSNGNGVKDSGETYTQGASVYLDLNDDGLAESNEPIAFTLANGIYQFSGLAPGSYIVRMFVNPGSYQTTPASGVGYSVNVAAGQTIANLNFGQNVYASISGIEFEDNNSDGVFGPGDATVAGLQVTLDPDVNGVLSPAFSTASTALDGSYAFNDLAPGTYLLREVLFQNGKQTLPAGGGGRTVTVVAGQSVTGQDFGQVRVAVTGGSVSGTVTGGPADETIYLDANNNSLLDSTELSTTTGPMGSYSFSSVPVGAYILRQVLPSGYTQTSPASGYGIHISVTQGGSLTNENFTDKAPVVVTTGSVAGTVIGGPSGETVYLDTNNNGVLDSGELSTTTSSTGAFSFANVPAGSYVLRQVLSGGYTQASPAANAGIAVTVTAGGSLTNENFIDTAPATSGGSISGTVTGGPAGETVYLDANNNSKLDTGELSTTTSSTGAFSFTGVPAGAYIVRQVLPTDYTQTTPSGGLGIHITVTSTSNLTNENFTDKAPAVVHTKLTGTTIGTAGSYNNDGNTIAQATDGNTSTFFDGQASNGNWVGLDLGSVESISQIAFAPRSSYASRMVGGEIQISTTADFSSAVTTIYTITAAPVSTLTTVTLSSPVTARYVRYLSPDGSHGDISEFEVFS